LESSRASISRNVLRRAGLVLAALGTAAIFFAFGVVARVLMGPVSLGPLNGELRSALRQQLPGLVLQFDEAALAWSGDEDRINLVVLGTRLYDDKGRVVAQAPEAEIGLAAGQLLLGHAVIRRIALVGVQLTLVHTKQGVLRLGVENEVSQNDLITEIRDAIDRSGMKGAPSLRSFAIRRARLAFYDEETGAFVVAPDAKLELTQETPSAKHALVADIDAQLEISGAPAHLLASIKVPRAGDTVDGDFSLSGLKLKALAANSTTFAFLKTFGLSTDVSGSFTLLHGTRIGYAEFGIGAAGTIGGLGRPFTLKSVRLAGRYDGRTGRLLIDDGLIQGERLQAHFTGMGDLGFGSDPAQLVGDFALTADRLSANMPGILPSDLSDVMCSLRGTYLSSNRQLVIEQAIISGASLSASLSGKVTLSPNTSPAVVMDGKVSPMGVRDLLHYWPLTVGSGVRAWIDSNIATGRIGPILVHTNLAAGALDHPVLPDDALAVSFPLSGATVSYISGLLPLTNLDGTAKLSGDTFTAQVVSAAVGHLAVSGGRVAIPNLQLSNPYGHRVFGAFHAHVEGELGDVLALIDMKPLRYPSRFHINPSSAGGLSSLDLDFHVPLVRNVPINRIGIGVKAAISGLALSLGPHTKITNGHADFDIDNSALRATGQVALGAANLDVDWLETFNAAPVTTHVSLRGVLDAQARAALDLPNWQFLAGPIGVDAALEGHWGGFQRASITADLTPASLAFDAVNISKPSGSPASARIEARLDEAGNIRSADVSISGSALSAQGSASFGPSGDLQHFSLDPVRDGSANDFSLAMSETAGGGLDIAITGHSVDGTSLDKKRLGSTNASKERATGSTEPFHLTAKVDQLVLRNGVVLSPFVLDAGGTGRRIKSLSVNAQLSKTAPLTANISSTASGRRLTLAAGDAGLLLKGVFGFASLKGGQLQLNATLPPAGPPQQKETPDYSGELVIHDCTLLNQAFLTRFFSSGSLTGFVDLMRGQGISIDTLHIPFSVTGDVIEIHDARASGPSIGVTTDGYIDRANDQIALQGAVAPLYGINGVLGSIPLLGNVFVSKKGEGIFGVTYSASGDADQPKIAVNPLSMLAPGIFRRIFETGAPSAPPPQASTGAPPSRAQ
jgi:hypothetical protein